MIVLNFIAHGSIEGVGDLWNGLLHPLRSPAQLMTILCLGLFAGQRRRFKWMLCSFVAAAAVGLGCTQIPGFTEPPAVLLGGISGVTGVLVAWRRPFPKAAGVLLFGVSGLALGLDSSPDALGAFVVFKMLAGVWVGLCVLMLNLANYAAMCPRKLWVKIAFRVLGSWIAAISALSLALSFKR